MLPQTCLIGAKPRLWVLSPRRVKACRSWMPRMRTVCASERNARVTGIRDCLGQADEDESSWGEEGSGSAPSALPRPHIGCPESCRYRRAPSRACEERSNAPSIGPAGSGQPCTRRGNTAIAAPRTAVGRDQPRTRGDHLGHRPRVPAVDGPTPQPAGTTRTRTTRTAAAWEQPRTRGDHSYAPCAPFASRGPTPHPRGPPQGVRRSGLPDGTNPAPRGPQLLTRLFRRAGTCFCCLAELGHRGLPVRQRLPGPRGRSRSPAPLWAAVHGGNRGSRGDRGSRGNRSHRPARPPGDARTPS